MTIKVSAVLSIHNRSRLFSRALQSYLWQTMPASDWEILLVDDMSTEDLSETYKKYEGRMNLRHIRMDHTKHHVWKLRHPHGAHTGFGENWFHTPALSTNLGCSMAKGDVICLCHPEILHKPENFALAHQRIMMTKEFLFGKTHLGTRSHNAWMDKNDWTKGGWDKFLENIRKVDFLGAFQPTELYWYTSFLPKKAIEVTRGVDFTYLHGVAGEDDDFKHRICLVGSQATWFPQIEGFHQDHFDEKEPHRDRNSLKWKEALARNREVFHYRCKHGFPATVNVDCDWTASECFVGETGITYDTP